MLWNSYPAPGNIRYENICRFGRVVPAWGPGGIPLGNCCRHVPLLRGANAQSAHMDTEDPGSLSVHVPLQPLHKGWHFYQDLMGDFSSMTWIFLAQEKRWYLSGLKCLVFFSAFPLFYWSLSPFLYPLDGPFVLSLFLSFFCSLFLYVFTFLSMFFYHSSTSIAILLYMIPFFVSFHFFFFLFSSFHFSLFICLPFSSLKRNQSALPG